MQTNTRIASAPDLPAIVEIYNDAITNSVATFDTQTKTVASQLPWFESHVGRHPIIVAEADGKVMGWCSLSPWSDRCAYADTAEISTYVHRDARGKGIGKQLKAHAIEMAKASGLHSLLSRVAGNNDVSNKLNATLGFERIGTMREVGKKFGKLHDVHLYQLILGR